VIQSERSHDAGITFGTTEGYQESKAPAAREDREEREEREDGSILSVLGSMIELGEAAAKFTFDQFQNGVYMLTDPGRALRRVQHSIDNVSRAMNEPVEDASARPES